MTIQRVIAVAVILGQVLVLLGLLPKVPVDVLSFIGLALAVAL